MTARPLNPSLVTDDGTETHSRGRRWHCGLDLRVLPPEARHGGRRRGGRPRRLEESLVLRKRRLDLPRTGGPTSRAGPDRRRHARPHPPPLGPPPPPRPPAAAPPAT